MGSSLATWSRRIASAGAWFMAVGSLGSLLWVLWWRWPGGDSVSQIMSMTVNGEDHTGLGMSYVGYGGTALVMAEAIAVLAAIVMSVLPAATPRRIGHVLLVAWAALWLGNAIYVSQFGFSALWAMLIASFSFLLLCTLARAATGWRASGAPGPAGVPVSS